MMISQLSRLVKPFILVIFLLFLAVQSCQDQITQRGKVSVRQLADVPECRVIQHRLGEICIPVKPQRIIALDVPIILDSLLALDIKPVGTVVDYWGGGRYFPAILPEKVAGIESVGAEGTPSLEKILMLKPDLILLPDYNTQYYKQLSAIAPTVLIDVWRDAALIPVKEVFEHIAQIVGQEEKTEEVFNQYQKRVEKFQELFGDRLKGLEVSVIAYYDGSFSFTPSFASYFQVFKDIGFSIKSVFSEKDEWSTFSVEVINQFDADILFIVDNPDTSAPYLLQQPLIMSLEAVKNGQAYIVDPNIWSFYGPIGMNLLLDNLSKYLLGEVQSPFLKHS